MEGAAMVGEGIPAAVIENAAMQCGMPVGPLAVLDETALSLSVQVLDQTRKDLAERGEVYQPSAGERLVERMVKELDRPGRAGGGGFYAYPEGEKKHLWPELATLFERAEVAWSVSDIQDRLLYRQAIETARCLHEGVLGTVHDANIGSIYGIGFPMWTGGAMQFIYGTGIAAFERRASELANKYGAGFALSDAVKVSIRKNEPQYEH
jgi:3-hydroxyacyl-CoA dehydrogenase/enoyl-CoA hydratase/3-hydroxybutyryl-CoA epimerase